MQTNFRGRDFIGDLDFTREEVETILDVAWDLKRKRALGEPHAYLRAKVLAMLCFFSSTRTRGQSTLLAGKRRTVKLFTRAQWASFGAPL